MGAFDYLIPAEEGKSEAGAFDYLIPSAQGDTLLSGQLEPLPRLTAYQDLPQAPTFEPQEPYVPETGYGLGQVPPPTPLPGDIEEEMRRREAPVMENLPFGGMMVAGQYVPPADVPATQAILQGQQNVDFLNRNLLFPTSPEFAQMAKEGRAELREDSPYAPGGPSDEELEQQYEKAHPYLHGIGKALEGFIPKSWEDVKHMTELPKPTQVERQMAESEELGKSWRGEYGPSAQAASITGTTLQALPMLHLPFARSPLRPKLTDLDLVGKIRARREAQMRTAVQGEPAVTARVAAEPAVTQVDPLQQLTAERNRLVIEELPKQNKGTNGEAFVLNRIAEIDKQLRDAMAERQANLEYELKPGEKMVEIGRPEPVAPAVEPTTQGMGITQAFSAKGATDVLYQKAFDALQRGETTISGVKDPIIARHKAAFDRGEIRSPEELKIAEEGKGAGGITPEEQARRQQYATKEGQVEGGVPVKRAGDGEGGAPTETGVGGGLQPTTKVPGRSPAPEAQAEVAPPAAEVVIPESERGYAGLEPPTTPPVSEPVPGGVPQKPSKIGQSIEAKAVEAKLTQGFPETAGYNPITIADQAQRATDLVKSSPAAARAVVRGEAPLPEGLFGESLITAMEEHLLRKPDAHVAYELANSPLVTATSEAAQAMRLMAERVPDSITAKFREIQAARREGAKLRGETSAKVARDISREVVNTASKRPTWEAFVREIAC